MSDPSTDEMVEVLRNAGEGDVLKATIEDKPCRLRVIEELSILFSPRTKGVKTRRVDDDAFRMVYFYLNPETEEPGDGVFARQSFADGFGSEDVEALGFVE